MLHVLHVQTDGIVLLVTSKVDGHSQLTQLGILIPDILKLCPGITTQDQVTEIFPSFNALIICKKKMLIVILLSF